MTGALRIFEYSSASVNDPGGLQLSVAEATAISRLNQHLGRDVLQVEYAVGKPRRLRTSSFVGVISIGRKVIHIVPKMAKVDPAADKSFSEEAIERAIANLLYMLRYTKKITVREVGLAALPKAQGDLLELLIFLFADNLLRLVQNGTYKQYSSCADILPFVKGKLRFPEQIKQDVSRKPQFALSYDEFGENNPLNQVFRYVTSMLRSVTVLETNRRLLRILDAIFADVTPRMVSATDANSIHLNRLNRTFEPVLNLCKLFLQHEIVQMDRGGTRTYSFLFDMNVLFEEFIGEFIRREFRSEFASIQLQGPRTDFVRMKSVDNIQRGSLFQLRPDIFFNRGNGAPPLIVDTKYKLLDPQADKEGVLQQDLYQMYAYARKYGCPDVVLLYPRRPGDQSHDVCFQIESEPLIRVFARTVDLCRDLRREKAELRKELSESLRTDSYSQWASA